MDEQLDPVAQAHVDLFRRRLPLQLHLAEIVRGLDVLQGLKCLEISNDNAMISYHLRKRGGNWQTVVSDEESARAATALVEENVRVLDESRLPFDDKFFDVLVIGGMENVRDDQAFIEECHRVLRPDGRLVIDVLRLKQYSLINPLRRLLGIDVDALDLHRLGYSESHLFALLKDGFDVHLVRSHLRFFVEFVDTWVRFAADRKGRGGTGGTPSAVATARVAKIAAPFYRIAFQVDLLLFAARGHRMTAVAKRRAWRPRKTPVLVDGRSISEAVLSKAAN